MNLTTSTIRRRAAGLTAALLVAGCSGETADTKAAKIRPMQTPAVNAVAIDARPEDRGGVYGEVILDGKSYPLTFLICSRGEPPTNFIGSTANESEMMRVRLKQHDNPTMPTEFKFQIHADDKSTQIIWQTADLEVKKTSDMTFDISGTVAGMGLRLNDKRTYQNDPSLDPENDLAFRATFTCK